MDCIYLHYHITSGNHGMYSNKKERILVTIRSTVNIILEKDEMNG